MLSWLKHNSDIICVTEDLCVALVMKQSAKTPLALYTGWFVRILESETMQIGFPILMIFVKEDSSKI